MQNLLPMRRVFVGASTPVFDGETTTGLANVFELERTGDFKDSADLSSLFSLSRAVVIGAGCSWPVFKGSSSCAVAGNESEARRWCRLTRGGRRGIVEDCSTPALSSEMCDQGATSLTPGAELLRLPVHINTPANLTPAGEDKTFTIDFIWQHHSRY